MYNYDGNESKKWFLGLTYEQQIEYLRKTIILFDRTPETLTYREIKLLWRKFINCK